MTLDEAPTGPPGLAFGATFSAAFKAVFGQFGMVLKAAILPFVLSLALGLVALLLTLGADATAEAGSTAYATLNFVLQLFGLVPFVLFGMACYRLVLIGRPAGALPRPLLGRRSLVYFGYTLLFLLILMLPMIVLAAALLGTKFILPGTLPANLGISEFTSYAGLVIPLLLLFYLFYLYLVTRLSLVFPAVAVDQRLGLGEAWRLTRGASGVKLYALLVVITILCLLVALLGNALFGSLLLALWLGPDGLPNMPDADAWMTLAAVTAPVMVFSLLFQYLSFALIIAAVAKAYGTLSGWGGPRAEILERFE